VAIRPSGCRRNAERRQIRPSNRHHTFLSSFQAPRRLSGGERQRGGTILIGQREASRKIPEAEQPTD
jgi:hypothetical protein